jgi:hypothetical protein
MWWARRELCEGGPGEMLELITVGYGAGRLAGPDGKSTPGSNEQQIETANLHPIFTRVLRGLAVTL